MPQIENGKTVYNVLPEQFADECEHMAKLGASVLGGCCGTTPDHIRSLVEKCKNYKPIVEEKNITVVASYSKTVVLGKGPVIVGETYQFRQVRKSLKKTLRNGDIDYILNEAFAQRDAGAHILDVNVGLPEIDECSTMEKAVKAISAAVNLPLQIDSSDPVTTERALRIYNGKPMVNSVNGKEESIKAIMPIVQKYGGVLVGLVLTRKVSLLLPNKDLKLQKIRDRASEYGIKPKNLVMDALTLTISAQQKESAETIKALKMIKDQLGICTTLGVSNISFGLPRREIVNGTFFALALNNGLDACIINPCADSMINTYRAFMALSCYDADCQEYVSKYAGTKSQTTVTKENQAEEKAENVNPLFDIIIKGLKDQSFDETVRQLETTDPMDIIKQHTC